MAVIALSVTALPACALVPDLQGHARVIDGDTIEVSGQRIRLHGIDAPETKQTCLDKSGHIWLCGKRASQALANLISKKTVKCIGRLQDRYRRLIAECFVGNTSINAWMIAQGWAVAYRYFSTDFVEQEERAKASHRGIWAGSFVMPWRWRRGDRLKNERDEE